MTELTVAFPNFSNAFKKSREAVLSHNTILPLKLHDTYYRTGGMCAFKNKTTGSSKIKSLVLLVLIRDVKVRFLKVHCPGSLTFLHINANVLKS